MIVIFFKNDIESVQDLMKVHQKSVAFWYAPGLGSYNYLSESISISELLVEEHIFSEFKLSYPELTHSFKCNTFATKGNWEHAPKRRPHLFLASSDTITRSFKTIIEKYSREGFKLLCKPKEHAKQAADMLGIPSEIVNLKVEDIAEHSVLVLGNDWGPTERKINEDFLSKGINTVCVQESSIDFNSHDNRMRFCSFPVFQGVATLQNFDVSGMICAVIGNPRFEELKPLRFPPDRKALVNVNFTYGIYEDKRNQWVEDIVSTCDELNIEYIISQHPRDNGDLSKYKVLRSSAMLVHDSIAESSVVISRFSALLTEAVCLGRPAVYYNPHGEKVDYKFEADDSMFYIARNKTELKRALSSINQQQNNGVNTDVTFLNKHLGVTNTQKASSYIKMLLDDVSTFPVLKRSKLTTRMIIYFVIMKRILRGQKY
jgi:hypothetical protein